MFLRSLALVKGTPATSATRSPQAAASSNTATHHAASRQPTVAAELVALTRLFKRLMRSRSAHGAATPHDPWQNTRADVRHLQTGSAFRRSRQAGSPEARPATPAGADRVPALHRRNPGTQRLSPVRIAADHHASRGHSALDAATPSTTLPRVHADPIDPQRVVISGSFAEVCAALDRLVARQEAIPCGFVNAS